MSHPAEATESLITGEGSRILHLLGAEAEHYHSEFAELPPGGFVVEKISGKNVQKQLDDLVWANKVLYEMGLLPVIVPGAGPQIDAAYESAGIAKADRVNGLRPTAAEAIPAVIEGATQSTQSIVEGLLAQDVEAVGITEGVFRAEPIDEATYQRVGRVTQVNLEPIMAALAERKVPVVAFLGQDADGNGLNINADSAAVALAQALTPKRFIAITDTGNGKPTGVLNEQNRLISVIDIDSEDYPKLLAEPWLEGGMELKVKEAQRLLESLEPEVGMSVSITDAVGMIKELFTHAGAGTLVRRGEPIEQYRTAKAIDKTRLTQTINAALDGKLVEGYFEHLKGSAYRVYVSSQSYRSVAIMTNPNPELGIAYLDKLAVTPEAQGQGEGDMMMRTLIDTNPGGFFWRARNDNPDIGFYDRWATGKETHPDWTVFWIGLDSDNTELINAAVGTARTQPITFERIRPAPVK